LRRAAGKTLPSRRVGRAEQRGQAAALGSRLPFRHFT
jgi:hypothetical protein